MLKKVFVLTPFAVALMFASVNAQEKPPQAPDQAQEATAQKFSDSQVKAFAHSYRQIAVIGQQLDAQLQSTDNAEKANQLQQAAHQQMVTAIQENDLAPETYNAIARAMQTDAELQKRIIGHLQ